MRADSIRHLFVYGTLKRSRSPQAEWLAGQSVWAGPASLPGRLVDLGGYPALLPASAPDEVVHGELWELPDDPATLEALDRYEGCHPDDPQPHEYCRIVCTARDENGVRLWCWTYLYPWGSELHPPIKGGSW